MHQICPPRHPTTQKFLPTGVYLLKGIRWASKFLFFCFLLMISGAALAQSSNSGGSTPNSQPTSTPSQSSGQNKPDQDIPDAPSAVRPTPLPAENPPAQEQTPPGEAP